MSWKYVGSHDNRMKKAQFWQKWPITTALQSKENGLLWIKELYPSAITSRTKIIRRRIRIKLCNRGLLTTSFIVGKFIIFCYCDAFKSQEVCRFRYRVNRIYTHTHTHNHTPYVRGCNLRVCKCTIASVAKIHDLTYKQQIWKRFS